MSISSFLLNGLIFFYLLEYCVNLQSMSVLDMSDLGKILTHVFPLATSLLSFDVVFALLI